MRGWHAKFLEFKPFFLPLRFRFCMPKHNIPSYTVPMTAKAHSFRLPFIISPGCDNRYSLYLPMVFYYQTQNYLNISTTWTTYITIRFTSPGTFSYCLGHERHHCPRRWGLPSASGFRSVHFTPQVTLLCRCAISLYGMSSVAY